jgi:hypothetical protein
MTTAPRQRDVVIRRARNDPAQYDDLIGEWWRPHGAFAMLHWIAEARSSLACIHRSVIGNPRGAPEGRRTG